MTMIPSWSLCLLRRRVGRPDDGSFRQMLCARRLVHHMPSRPTATTTTTSTTRPRARFSTALGPDGSGRAAARWTMLGLGAARAGADGWRARRPFSVSSARAHGHITPPRPGEELRVTIVDKEGDEHSFTVATGDNILDIAQANDLEMEGACGGSCACSTCHVIVQDPAMYDKMPEPDDEENDMLDLAFGLTETSRLGCQVKMGPELDGLRVRLPAMTRNMQPSDFSKQ
ncbi:MAG: hypothetical protein M1826_002434 [Phylliscum demangeonii]|nr:MAG: hypothetical protein M1826_002434 [Phylliscum demangeonii]